MPQPQQQTVDPYDKYLDSTHSTQAVDPYDKYLDAAPAAAPPSTFDKVVSGAGNYLGALNQQINPLSEQNRGGMYNLTHSPLETLKGMGAAQSGLADEAKANFKQGNYGMAARKAINYMFPILGPQIDQAQAAADRGEWGTSLGTATGIGFNAAVSSPEVSFRPRMIPGDLYPPPKVTPGYGVQPKPGMMDIAHKLYYQAIKGGLRTQINTPPEEVNKMVHTGMGGGYEINQGGIDKLWRDVQSEGKTTDAIIAGKGDMGFAATQPDLQDKLSTVPRQISQREIASATEPVYDRFMYQMDPTGDLKSMTDVLESFRNHHPELMDPEYVQKLKKGTYERLGSRAYDEVKTASVETEKGLAKGAMQALERRFPEIKDINEGTGEKLDFEDVLQRAVNKNFNNRSNWLKDAAAAGATKAVTGHGSVAIAAAILRHVLMDPEVQSKLAIKIYQAQQRAPGTHIRPGMMSVQGRINSMLQALNPNPTSKDGQ